MFERVDDPKILQQFGVTSDSSYEEVTDPNIISKFSADKATSFLNSLKNSPTTLLENPKLSELKTTKGLGKALVGASGTLSMLAQPELAVGGRIAAPLINSLARSGIGTAGATAAQYGETGITPTSSQIGKNALFNLGLEGATKLGSKIIPLVSHIPGVSYLANKLGLTSLPPGLELLEHTNPENVMQSLEASKRLGTPITPAEASGNPYLGRLEGQYGRVGESSATKTSIGLERLEKQKNAVKTLLNDIYDQSISSNNKIRDLYKTAYLWNLKPEIIQQFKQDPIIESAFNTVANDKAWKRKLANVPENNFAYLDKVKKVISDEEGKLIKSGQKEKAAEYTDARTNLMELMDSSNPSYKAAREEAQRKIIRNQLQKKLKTSDYRGTTFYKEILNNDHEFNNLINKLKNVPEAQNKLNDMRLAWKNLINIETPRAAAGKAESNMEMARNAVDSLINMVNEFTGNKRNINALKFIHSGEWEKGFNQLLKIKDERKRMEQLANMLGRTMTSKILQNSQGREYANSSTSTDT